MSECRIAAWAVRGPGRNFGSNAKRPVGPVDNDSGLRFAVTGPPLGDAFAGPIRSDCRAGRQLTGDGFLVEGSH